MKTVIVIPGMGCTPIASSNWYTWLADELQKRVNVECSLTDFPDPHMCRESQWIPFVEQLIGDNASNTIVVGHSSGAACAMRLLERTTERPLDGCILVAAAYTDLNDADERKSEYFNRPWDWNRMSQGSSKIVLFHGTDDPLIPIEEAKFIAKKLECYEHFTFRQMPRKSHFFRPWPEILEEIDLICTLSP